MDSASTFHPSEIVCIEHEEVRLYAEVIQLSETRPVCWLRPLLLVTLVSEEQSAACDVSALASSVPPLGRSLESERIHSMIDLREGADLLLPTALMRHALDVELIPLWSALHSLKPAAEGDRPVQNPLHSLTQRLWAAYPTSFESSEKKCS
ncbi:hypothetical protein [Leptolyngbya sp. O-77]|uniref:hypothetical protein n=1 Tax=Leptolyngbya sp. O-77 TaxID=1080068 RepID=UPI00074D4354|nr:hypothetical protein [Leptolyngbya sp. O-77]BAU42943.1 hypothetical protein O77CONTIG1_02765 [Leptolyngbya sp. O-77]